MNRFAYGKYRFILTLSHLKHFYVFKIATHILTRLSSHIKSIYTLYQVQLARIKFKSNDFTVYIVFMVKIIIIIERRQLIRRK